MRAASAQSVLPPVPANPPLTYHIPSFTGSLEQGTLTGMPDDPLRFVYGGEAVLTAQKLVTDTWEHRYEAIGETRLTEMTSSVSANGAVYDSMAGIATARDAVLYRRPYLVHAQKLVLDKDKIVASNGTLTTAPPGVSPAAVLRGKTITLYPKTGKGTVRDGTLLLFGLPVAALRKYDFYYGAGAAGHSSQLFNEEAGVSGRLGTFLSFTGQQGRGLPIDIDALFPSRTNIEGRLKYAEAIRLRGHRPRPPLRTNERRTQPASGTPSNAEPTGLNPGPLATLRRFAIGGGLLPDGDPLLLQSFVPSFTTIKPLAARPGAALQAAEEVSTNIASSGNSIDNLYVSRLPEISFAWRQPLSSVSRMPTTGDPVAFRQYLKRVAWYAGINAAAGRYEEQPTDITDDRLQYQASLGAAPFMVLPNTMIAPRVVISRSLYANSDDHYDYGQAAVSVMHYVSDRTAFGADYTFSDVSGQSPFNFDVLDSAHELDGRMQVGNEKLAVGGVVRYDLDRGRVIDYQATLAPNVRGLIPVLTYTFMTRSFGVGFAIDKVAF